MPKDLIATRIDSKEAYEKLFSSGKRAELLKTAMNVRKFEIEMYWKRTAFFWAFIVSIYTAFFFLLTKQKSDEYAIYLVGLSFLAIVFSIAWIFANKGSKFWQENWEQHVSLLESEPLYDVFLNSKETCSWWNPFKEYDFSVSKINLFLSHVVFFSSLFIFFISLQSFFHWHFCCECQEITLFIILGVLAILATIWGFCHCKGHKNLKITNNVEKSPFIPMVHIQRGQK